MMIQTIALIVAFLLPIAACGGLAFKLAMDAHAEFYRYEQTHSGEERIELLDTDEGQKS